MTDELCYLSAAAALRLFRRRELSPVELLRAVIARAEAVEAPLNAFSNRYFERALEQAAVAEARYAGRGAPPRPLEGIPTALKEEEPLAGEVWTQGSLIYAARIATETSAYSHCGPLARTVQDCLLFENVLAGPDPQDHVSLYPKLELPELLTDVRGLRIALSPDLGDWPLDPEIRANTLSLARALQDEGAIVDEVEVYVPRRKALRAMDIHFKLGFSRWLDTLCRQHPDLVTDYARDFAQHGFTGAEDGTLYEKFELEAELYRPIGATLQRYDALICATNGTRGLAAGESYVGHGPDVDGRPQTHYFDGILTPVFNLFSRCPVLNVPSGFAANGVPTGIQIVGRPYEDVIPFRIGAACERARPWLDGPERRPRLAAPDNDRSAPPALPP